MSLLFILAKWMLLGICFSGYALYLQQKLKINVHFIPVIICSGITIMLYLGALVWQLPLVTNAVIVVGVALFLLQLVFLLKKRTITAAVKVFFTPGIVVFLALAVFFIIYFNGARHTLGDVYAHWGLVTKYMDLTNQLPDANATVIAFQAYPPGSSLFQYFITRIVPYSEGRVIWANMLLMLAGLCSLFALVPANKQNWLVVVSLVEGGAFLLLNKVVVFDILVDTLLAAVAISGAVALLYKEHDLFQAIIVAALPTALCLLIKNSGIFFLLANGIILLAVIGMKKLRGIKRKEWAAVAFFFLLSILLLFLWNGHVEHTFNDGELTKHAMSVDNVEKGMTEKTPENTGLIIKLFLRKAFSYKLGGFLLDFLILNTAMAALLVFIARKNKSQFKGLAIHMMAGNAILLLYMVGFLLMYLTTMPLEESLVMASYERYYATISGYIYVYFTCVALLQIVQLKPAHNKPAKYGAAIFWLMVSLAMLPTYRANLTRPLYEGTLPALIDELTEPMEREPSAFFYLVVAPEEYPHMRSSLSALLRYKLFTVRVNTVDDFEENKAWVEENIHIHSVLMVLVEDEGAKRFIAANAKVTDVSDDGIGLYFLPLDSPPFPAIFPAQR